MRTIDVGMTCTEEAARAVAKAYLAQSGKVMTRLRVYYQDAKGRQRKVTIDSRELSTATNA